MEKYGVSEDASPEKQAQVKENQCCPKCGATLRDSNDTGVLLCPHCGSLPFEEEK